MNPTYNKKKYIVTIKNKWTNSSRVVMINSTDDVQKAHKYAYYNHTNNLEEIVSMADHRKNLLFTLRGGFKRGK